MPSGEKATRFRDRQKIYKKECDKARLNAWRELQTNLDDVSGMNRFRKIVQGSEQVRYETLTKENGEQKKPGINIFELFSQIHLNKATTLKPTPYKPDRIYESTIDNWDNNIITEEKVLAAFKNFQGKEIPRN